MRSGMNLLKLKIEPKPGQGIYVYQFPVRAWHWTIFICIFVLFYTGGLIGNPPQSITGDPTYLFNFGYIIMAHYTAAFIFCIAMLCRIIWAFFGNAISREIFIPHIWQKSWWQGLINDIKWYLFIKKTPDFNLGHNPLAQIAMFFAVLAMIWMCLTGLGIYQAKGTTSSFFHLFSFMEEFAYWTGGNVIDLVVWHKLGRTFLVVFVIVHIYMVIREDIMGRSTMVTTMINGYRMVRDKPKENREVLEQEIKQKTNA